MNRRRLIVFDMDGTLTSTNSWYILNMAMGITKEEDEELGRCYHNGQITYAGWIHEIVRKYIICRHSNRDYMNNAVQNFELRPGAEEIVGLIRARRDEIAIISGATNIAVDAVGGHLGINHRSYNTELQFNNLGWLSGHNCLGGDADMKASQLRQLCRSQGFGLSDCIPVGDSLNDRPLFEITGNGVTFEECSCLHPFAKHRIVDLYDLAKVLYPA